MLIEGIAADHLIADKGYATIPTQSSNRPHGKA